MTSTATSSNSSSSVCPQTSLEALHGIQLNLSHEEAQAIYLPMQQVSLTFLLNLCKGGGLLQRQSTLDYHAGVSNPTIM
jgi:hypothetical protein